MRQLRASRRWAGVALVACLLLSACAVESGRPERSAQPSIRSPQQTGGAKQALEGTPLAFPDDGVLPPERDVEPLCKCKADRQYFNERVPEPLPMPPGFTERCPGGFTDPNRSFIDTMEVPTREPLPVTTEAVAFTAPDGSTIPAWVSRPDDNERYPAVVYAHGGLGEPALDEPGRTIAEAGFVVITPGYRGTAFEGMEPQQAVRMADPGHGDIADVLAAADWVQQHERTSGRIAIIGSSIGGAIANEIAFMEPDRFDAVVDLFGITDWACVMKIVSYGQSSAWVIGGAFGGTPEEVPEEYLRVSPLYHADEVTAPVYIAHGLQDTTFPPGASQQWAEALQRSGVDVTFRPYATEGHSFVLHEPFESPAWQDIFNWLDRHIS